MKHDCVWNGILLASFYDFHAKLQLNSRPKADFDPSVTGTIALFTVLGAILEK